MDFHLTEEQQLLKQNVRRFLEAEIAPQVDEYEAKGPMTREDAISFIKMLKPFGYYNGRASEELGGSNLDAKTAGLLIEELSRVWAALAGVVFIAGPGAVPAMLSDADQREFRDRVRAGESIGSGGISEPDHGSDSSWLETRAVLDGDEWVINGTKTWISNGPIADHINLNVTIDPEAGREGLRTVYVDRETSPYQTVRHNPLIGCRAWPNGQLAFDNVRVPRRNLRERNGARSEAPQSARRVWNFDSPRSTLAAMSVGIAQAAIDASIRYAQERHQFGRPIGSFQLVQELIVDSVIETECARLLAYQALDMQDNGEDATWQASAAKAYATEMAIRVTSRAIEVHGGVGLMEDYPLERYFRDARTLTIPDGTTEIQKLVIGRRLLGISAIS
jgi:alkylation response protein AidB-like acyl-CoA dehydrogenase